MRLFLCLLLCAMCSSAQALRVGRAVVDITPAVGTPMAGYYALRLSTGVHDPLQAKALVMESGGQRAALVACDLVAMPAAVVEQARQRIAQRSGIPASHVMISATHSHTGPVLPSGGAREAAFGGEHPLTKEYVSKLPNLIAQAVEQATRDLQAARISVGRGREESVSFNRRFFMRDGSVGWNPGKRNPNIVRPAGPIHPALPVLLFETPEGKPLATYVNFALHLDTVGGTEFSADYPGTVASLLGSVKGNGMMTLFTIGAAGNLNHLNVQSPTPQKGHAEAARIGTVLAGEVLKTYTRLMPLTETALMARSATLALAPASLQPGDVERATTLAARVGTPQTPPFLDTVFAFKALDVEARKSRPYEAEVQVIALGDEVAWVALPGEVFTELGQAIERDSPFPHTIVVELAHGPTTYFPNEAAFPQGNYEVVTSRVARGSGEQMVASALTLLHGMHPRGRTTDQPTSPGTTTRLFNGSNLDGWYTWLRDERYDDPKGVFSVRDGMIRISGEDWGGLTTRNRYRDYRLRVEWKWGEKTWGAREKAARDSGVLVHAVGRDGGYGGTWLESIEAQIIEGGTGDFILVGGEQQPALTVEAREGAGGELYWERGAKPTRRDRGRFNWFGRDPDWKDTLNFRGKQDLEKPAGEWNTLEVVCEGDTITNLVNGVVVNRGSKASHTAGRIQIQSEGAEIWIRKVEISPLR